MAGKNCVICGEPSGMYPLCRKHLQLKQEGKVIKDENGSWIEVVEPVKEENKASSEPVKESVKCLLCGKDANTSLFFLKEHMLCDQCFEKYKKQLTDLDKNMNKYEVSDYYYNLRASIYRLENYDIILNQITKLMGLAWINQSINKDTYLSNVVEEDITKIISKKKYIIEKQINSKSDQKDNATISIVNFEKNRAQDGHLCKSEKEVIIDDFLYSNHICHAYGVMVKEIPTSKERAIYADWYIPLSGSKGIYIEYWGMDTADYNDNKEEKLKLYEKYADRVKLISINKGELDDRQTFNNNLYQQLYEMGWKPEED